MKTGLAILGSYLSLVEKRAYNRFLSMLDLGRLLSLLEILLIKFFFILFSAALLLGGFGISYLIFFFLLEINHVIHEPTAKN